MAPVMVFGIAIISFIVIKAQAQESLFVRTMEYSEIKSWTTAVMTIEIDEVVNHSQKALRTLESFRGHLRNHGLRLHPLQDELLRNKERSLHSALGHIEEDGSLLTLTRQRRSVNLDLSLDVSSVVQHTFDGISNLFYGTNFRELSKQIKEADIKMASLAGSSARAFRRIEKSLKSAHSKIQAAEKEALSISERDSACSAIGQALEFSTRQLERLDEAAPSLANGQLPGALIPIWQAKTIVANVNVKAQGKGLESAVRSPVDLYNLPAMMKANSSTWEIMIKIPLVARGPKTFMWRFVGLPVLDLGGAAKVATPSATLIVPPEGLPADLKTTTLTQEDFQEFCQILSGRAICRPVPSFRNGFLPCIAKLWRNDRDAMSTCQFRPSKPEDHLPRRVGSELVIFPSVATQLSLTCEGKRPVIFEAPANSLLRKEVNPGCKVTSETWDLAFPKDAGKPEVKKVTVMPPWSQPKAVDWMDRISDIGHHHDTKSQLDQLDAELTDLEEVMKNWTTIQESHSGWDTGDVTSTSFSAAAMVLVGLVLAKCCWQRSHKPEGIRVTLPKPESG
jgi:hypothetical protein